MKFSMLRARFVPYYVALLIPPAAYFVGSYFQGQLDETQTLYRNKSRLFGGRKLAEGEKAW